MELNYNINSDVGEGMGDDTALMPLIQACNIACG
ncbi:LamB/YcsF family protein, partial [Flavobacteriaceae bacterium]|nr:LamB/YcsF family protein [Flavobacteriaceae bacterium]